MIDGFPIDNLAQPNTFGSNPYGQPINPVRPYQLLVDAWIKEGFHLKHGFGILVPQRSRWEKWWNDAARHGFWMAKFMGWVISMKCHKFWKINRWFQIQNENKSPMKTNSFQVRITLPETNIASENWPFQKGSSLPTIHFQVRAVSFREGTSGLHTPPGVLSLQRTL